MSLIIKTIYFSYFVINNNNNNNVNALHTTPKPALKLKTSKKQRKNEVSAVRELSLKGERLGLRNIVLR